MKISQLYNRLPKSSLLYFAAGLFVLSIITSYYFQAKPSVDYHKRLLERYIQNQLQDADELMRDSSLMRKLVLEQASLEEFTSVSQKQYGVFLFAETLSENQELLYWNNQKIVPPEADFSLADGISFHQLSNGYYVVIKRTLRFSGMSNNIMSYILIPVLHQYYLETDYLVSSFAHDKNAVQKINVSLVPTEFPIKASDGKTLFYLKSLSEASVASTDILTIIIRLIALLLLLVFFHLHAESIVRKKGALKGILFLVSAVIICRSLFYIFPSFFSVRQFQLFDPSIYAANWFNRSLGDLLINAISLCWMVVFICNHIDGVKISILKPTRKAFVTGMVGILILVFTTFYLGNVVNSLVANSKISFNVNDFFNLNIYTVFGFIILAILSLTYYYFSSILFRFIFPAFKKRIIIYLSISVLGLLYLTLLSGGSIVLFHLPILIWLLLYTLLYSNEKEIKNRFRVSIASTLIWIFIFSASLAVLIMHGNKENEIRIRKQIAEKLHQTTDPSSERTLSIAIAYLDNWFLLQNFNRFYDPEENSLFRDSIINENFSGYINKYETEIFVFNENNQPVNNNSGRTFPELNTIFTVQSKPTGTPDLFYHETSFDKFAYITKRVVRDESQTRGTIFIVSTPKKYGSTDALYPELFRQMGGNDVENSSLYSYAIYIDQLLITSSAKYPFQISLTQDQVPVDEYERKENGDFNELWYKASNKKVIVVAKKKSSFIESISLFSYLFCAFLFMVGIMHIFSLILQFAGNRLPLKIFSDITIRTQIHGTIIFISILSFLIIGVATISFFILRYNRNNIDKLSRTAGIAVKEIEKQTARDSIVANEVDFYDSSSKARMQTVVQDIADIHNVDVNLYDLKGNLQVSSDEDVYRKGILSSKMHPLAYYHLSNLREVQRVQQETVGHLQYQSIYTVLRDEKGKVYAYLNIPYFSSQLDLKQEISNFLVTIINLNAFIFLIAGVIALFITNKITRSFSVISDKMKDITLGKTNEEIVWTKNDEIGELVKQYNIMVSQLEESAEALAKSEREGAWREMARQVAHEIKNPLTPMKLSMQYLQKAINNNQENVKELTASVAATLIEQIDHLSKIASDFSQFANIGNKKIIRIDLHQIINSLVELYKMNPKIKISWSKVSQNLIMEADKTQMNRLFTNIFTNAVDACSSKKVCKITITEEIKDDEVLIAISDNGEGIPAEMRSKIFTPNFTTKTSGTGLGLAMCKNIVEQANGKIWFDTNAGEGTTFYIQLPIVN